MKIERGLIILDLDNTIANDEWRIPKIKWDKENPIERYHDYHSVSAFDEACNKDLFEVSGHTIVVVTARPTIYRAVTEEWLDRNGVNFSCLIMRNEDDHAHSRDLKRRQILWFMDAFNARTSDIVCAYDDRQDVIDMYAALGIRAELRKIHDTCAFTNPKEAS